MSKEKTVVVVADEKSLKSLLSPEKPAAESSKPASESVTHHHWEDLEGNSLEYTATVAMKTISLDDQPKGSLFYVAYIAKNPKKNRPLTFCFNGGPGSASVWLHIGVFGPRRVRLDVDNFPPPPWKAEDNPRSLLGESDLVFIDPMSTGFSRTKEGDARGYHGVDADLASVGEFIYRYCTENNRWGSPIYLAGESYGTTRAAGLARHLQKRYSLYTRGLVLLSLALSYQPLVYAPGNLLPFALTLPTMTATAHYHGLIEGDLASLITESEQFAINQYLPYLVWGDRQPADTRAAVEQRLSELCGLPLSTIERLRGRVTLERFRRELLRTKQLVVGRLDSRFTGPAHGHDDEASAHDPSLTIDAPFAAVLHQELAGRLDYQDEGIYEILNFKVWPWKFDGADNSFFNVAPRLAEALTASPCMKVFVACGVYDLATTPHAALHMVSTLPIHDDLRKNFVVKHYNAGHMMYLHEESMSALHQDLQAFYHQG